MRTILPRILAVLAFGATLAGCTGLGVATGTASLAIADMAGAPAPVQEATPEGSVPASVLSYAEANGPSDDVEVLMAYYADVYDVPLSLVRRTAARESDFNPKARTGPYWGLMQMLPQTARTMGYTGPREGLLDPDTNLKYAVKYLAGAYLVAGGDEARADWLYRTGYYYEAKRKGLLEETGLRP